MQPFPAVQSRTRLAQQHQRKGCRPGPQPFRSAGGHAHSAAQLPTRPPAHPAPAQEEDVIGVLPSSGKVAQLKPLSDRVLIQVGLGGGRAGGGRHGEAAGEGGRGAEGGVREQGASPGCWAPHHVMGQRAGGDWVAAGCWPAAGLCGKRSGGWPGRRTGGHCAGGGRLRVVGASGAARGPPAPAVTALPSRQCAPAWDAACPLKGDVIPRPLPPAWLSPRPPRRRTRARAACCWPPRARSGPRSARWGGGWGEAQGWAGRQRRHGRHSVPSHAVRLPH